jgi:hypothetical protein
MWGPRRNREQRSVTCIACGDSISRSDAREYDKLGDRWEREGKDFEFLCKGCFRELCHQPREDLESLLTESGAGERGRKDFFARYDELIEERYGALEDARDAEERER